MKMGRFNKIFSIIFLLGLMLFAQSCIKEDNDDCHKSLLLSVKALDADNNDITTDGVIKDIDLYIYDENGSFLEKSTVTPDEIKNEKEILLDYPSHKSLTVVAWANLAQKPLQYESIKPEHSLSSTLSISLTKNDQSECQSPGDLFFGRKEIQLEEGIGKSHATLVMKRKTSSICVITKNLRQWANIPGDDYYYKIVGTKDTYATFTGLLGGNEALFHPASVWNESDNLVAPLFETFPSADGQSVEVQIYKGDECIYRVSTDNSGLALKVEEGRTLEVIIDFQAAISVTVYINDWHSVSQHVDI